MHNLPMALDLCIMETIDFKNFIDVEEIGSVVLIKDLDVPRSIPCNKERC